MPERWTYVGFKAPQLGHHGVEVTHVDLMATDLNVIDGVVHAVAQDGGEYRWCMDMITEIYQAPHRP